MSTTDEAIRNARASMFNIELDHIIEVTQTGGGHHHVAIAWAGGVLWLDMSDLGNHYCVDVRQFDHDGNEKPIGVFGIEAGRRVTLDTSEVPEAERVTAFNWPATHMPILLTDKED